MKFVKALPIPLLYLVVGTLCVYFSDGIVAFFFPASQQDLSYQTIKGFFLVWSTALLLYIILKRFKKRQFQQYPAIKAKEQTLPESEKAYKALFHSELLARILFEADTGSILDVNQEAQALFGYPAEKLIGRNIFKELNSLAAISRIDPAETRKNILSHLRPDHRKIKLEVSSVRFKSEGKDCILLQCMDVTEREQALYTLTGLQEKLTAAQTIAKIGYWQYNLAKGKMFWSDEIYEIWGVRKAYFVPDYESFLASVHPDDRMLLPSSITLPGEDFSGYDMEHRIILADGAVKWIHVRGVLKKSATGDALCLEGTVQDITAQKLLSISLEQNLERYNYVTRAVSDVIWDWNLPTQKVVWSTGASETLLDLVVKKGSEARWEDHIIAEDKGRVLDGLKQSLASNQSFWNDEYRCLTNDHHYLYVKSRAYILRNNKNEAVRIIGAISDITEAKRKALRNELKAAIAKGFHSQATLQDGLSAVLSSICRIGNFDVAEAWIVGSGRQLINRVAVSAGENLKDRPYGCLSSIETFEKGQGLPGLCWEAANTIHCHALFDDTRFERHECARELGITSMYAIPLIYNNQIKGVVTLGLMKDNVESRIFSSLPDSFDSDLASEIHRKQTEEELNQLFDFVPDIICVVGLDGYLKKMNPAITTILGHSEEVLRAHPLTHFIYPEDWEETLQQINLLKNTKSVVYLENRFIRGDGTLKWIAWTATAPSAEGLVFCVAKDITEKKELQLLLEKASSLAMIGAWEIDLVKKEIHWSAMTRQIHGIKDDSYDPDFDEAMFFYKEGAHREAIIEMTTRAVENGEKWDLESQIITSQNETKWVRSMGEPQFVNGVCVRIVGSLQDINATKRNEWAALEALREKEMILERIGDAFFAVDRSWKVTYWNNKAEQILGRRKADMINSDLWEEYADAINTPFYHNYFEAMDTGQSRYFQAYYEGTQNWFDVGAFPSPTGLSVFFRDITEQVQYISSIEQYNNTLKEIAWSQSHEVRAPLMRLLGLASLIKDIQTDTSAELKEIIDMIVASVHDLDEIVKKINNKTQIQ